MKSATAQLKLWGDTVSAVNPQAFLYPGPGPAGSGAPAFHHSRGVFPTGRPQRSGSGLAAERQKRQEAYCTMQKPARSAAYSRWRVLHAVLFRGFHSSPAAELATYIHDGWRHRFRPWMTKFKAEVFDKRWVPVVEQALCLACQE